MADIEKFTGYKAIDGSTHKTAKAAISHTREVKIKAALTAAFTGEFSEEQAGVSRDDRGNLVVFPENLPTFLYANREAISAAFKQDVVLRAPRGKKRDLKAEAAAKSRPIAPGIGEVSSVPPQ